MKKIKALHNKVKALLEEGAMYRDSDEKLVARLINNELRAKAIDPQTIKVTEKNITAAKKKAYAKLAKSSALKFVDRKQTDTYNTD